MEIKVSKIKEELIKLNALIESYETNYLNLYNTINDTSNYWQDDYSKLFFEYTNKNKINISNMIEEIKDIKKTYDHIVTKYENIGNTIKFDLKNKENVVLYLDACINQYKNIINSYESLDISFCSEAYQIRSEITNIKDNKEKLEEYKEKIKKQISYIEETEKEIAAKIYNINIDILEVQDIENFI